MNKVHRRTSLWILSLLSFTLTACQAATPTPTQPSAEPNPSASAVTPTPTPEPTAPGSASPSIQPSTPPTATPLPIPSGGGSSATINLPDGTRLVLTLPTRFLNDAGQAITVGVQLLNANGQPQPLGDLVLRFSSSRPQDFSVNDQGLVTALVEDGFSLITVQVVGTELSATQQISVNALRSGGGGGGGSVTASASPQERVNAEIGFEGLSRGEFRVNEDTVYTQDNPAVAADSNGNFVVVWESTSEDLFEDGIYAQRFTSAGIPQGASFLVNQETTTDSQDQARVAMNASGDFALTWVDEHSGQVYARRYSELGVAEGNEFVVSSLTTDLKDMPDIAMDNSGQFVVSWTNSTNDVYARRYDSLGVASGTEFVVSTLGGENATARVAMDNDGDFALAWISNASGLDSVYARRFNSVGSAQDTTEFLVNAFTTSVSALHPDIAMNAAGSFVIAWEAPDANSNGVYARRYNNAGVALDAANLAVNTYTSSSQAMPQVGMDSQGDFIVTWTSAGQDSVPFSVHGQRFSGGNRDGVEFSVNRIFDAANYQAGIAVTPDGRAVTTWTDGAEIYAKRYTSTGQAQ